MTEEVLTQANYILKDIHWCQTILDRMERNYEIKFEFEDGENGLTIDDQEKCPEWLKEIIKIEVTKQRDALSKVFMEI